VTGYFVAVAGNIGVGKSTLIDLMASKLGWAPFFESFEENPYLADFYSDMPRWGFHSQAFFLSRRLRQHYLVLQQPGPVLQDRSVYEDAEVFARNLYRQGYLTERDWQTYCDLYKTLSVLLKPPNLIVYLKASVPTLLHRIAQRGREYERTISSEYLAALNELYNEWVAAFTICPVLTVVTDNLDYVQHDEHLTQIVQRLQDRLHGKELLDFGS
jgi:deoxyadenosine/deoxycytidine kinase